MRDNKEMKMKYSVLPSRMVQDKRFKISHYNVMVCLGCHAGKSGLVYLTHQSIELECPHIKRETIKKALNELVLWGYLYRLEPKFMPGQVSKWKTNRYMVVYTPDQPIPKYEDLKKEVVNFDRMDEDTQAEVQAEVPIDLRANAEENVRVCMEGVNVASGQRPLYKVNEYLSIVSDNLTIDRHEVVIFARAYIKQHRRNPNLKEVLTYVTS